MTEDYRSPLAKARDAWLESEEGKSCSGGTANGVYLENRLIKAFMAGAEAAEKLQKEPTND